MKQAFFYILFGVGSLTHQTTLLNHSFYGKDFSPHTPRQEARRAVSRRLMLFGSDLVRFEVVRMVRSSVRRMHIETRVFFQKEKLLL